MKLISSHHLYTFCSKNQQELAKRDMQALQYRFHRSVTHDHIIYYYVPLFTYGRKCLTTDKKLIHHGYARLNTGLLAVRMDCFLAFQKMKTFLITGQTSTGAKKIFCRPFEVLFITDICLHLKLDIKSPMTTDEKSKKIQIIRRIRTGYKSYHLCNRGVSVRYSDKKSHQCNYSKYLPHTSS